MGKIKAFFSTIWDVIKIVYRTIIDILKTIFKIIAIGLQNKYSRPFTVAILIVFITFSYLTWGTKTIRGKVVSLPIEDGYTTITIQKDFIDKNNETFVNQDNWLVFKINSRDVVNVLTPGVNCVVKVNWIRWPILSWSRNIVRVIEPKREKVK